MDLSLTLLAQPPKLPRVAGDMCRLPFAGGTFDWVLNFFTSFGYFAGERENFRVLEEICRVLAAGGRFVIDLFNRQRVLAGLVGRESQERDGHRLEIERWFDETTQRVNKRIDLVSADGERQSWLESVRAYREQEVTIGLGWAGLEVTGVYGNFNGESFDSDSSERLIVTGRKPV